MLSRQYGYKPFDKELYDDLANPFRRELLIASLQIETDTQLVLKSLPDIIKSIHDFLNVHGTSICRCLGSKTKGIFKSLGKKKPKKDSGNITTLPDGSQARIRWKK